MQSLFMRRARAAAVVVLAASSAAQAALVGANLLAQVGQPLPNSDGLTVSSLNTPFTNGLGEVGFTGILANPPAGTNGGFVFVKSQVVHKNYAVTPPPVVSGVEASMGITNNLDWIFSPSVDGNDAVYTNNGTLLKETDAAPDLPGETVTFNSRPSASADNFYWVAGTASHRALYKAGTGAGATISSVILGGATVGGQQLTNTGLSFTYKVSDNNGHFISAGTFTGATATDAGVFVDGTTIVGREGSPVPGGLAGENWTSFRAVSINDSGNWLMSGDSTAVAAQDEVVLYNGAILQRAGDVIDGLTLGGQTDAISINNGNQIAVIWDTTGAATEALFYGSATNPASFFRVLQLGDTIDTNGDNIADYTLSDFNAATIIDAGLDIADDGKIWLDVDLTPIGGSSAVQSIIGVAIPEPGSAIALVSLGALAIARRHRRNCVR